MRRHIAFRDYLRSHPETAGRYGAHKLDLAARFSGDRGSYTVAKSAFVAEVSRLAREGG